MPNTKNPGSGKNAGHERGGDHEQHVQAGEQSRGGGTKPGSGGSQRGGSHEQHVKAGEQSHKNG